MDQPGKPTKDSRPFQGRRPRPAAAQTRSQVAKAKNSGDLACSSQVIGRCGHHFDRRLGVVQQVAAGGAGLRRCLEQRDDVAPSLYFTEIS